MRFFRDAIQGRLGLGPTYWGLLIIGGAVCLVLQGFVQSWARSQGGAGTVPGMIGTVAALLYLGWVVFAGVSVIRAACYERKPGFWGWVAIFIAGINILYAVLGLFGVARGEWARVEWAVERANREFVKAGPVEGIVLSATTQEADHSVELTMAFQDGLPQDLDALRVRVEKAMAAEGCSDYSDFLLPSVETLRVRYLDPKTGASITVQLDPATCHH